MSSIPRFYVYILARPDGTPFYIGKGSNRRILAHEQEAKRGHRCHKCHIIRKIWRNGGEVQRYTVFTTDDEGAAYAYETELIALHGRNNLTNRADGGMGPNGATIVRSRSYRQKQSQAQRARFQDPAQRARFRAVRIAWGQSAEGHDQVRRLNERRWSDPVQHEKLRVQNARRWADPAQRAALAARNRTPEARAKLSETRKAQWADPEYRAKMLAAQAAKKNKS